MKYVTSDTYQSKIFGLNTFHLFHHVSSIFSCSCSFVLCDAQRCAPFVQQLFEVKLKLGNQLPTLPTAMGGLWKALLCLLWLVASAWPWGPPVWQGDVWWRLHMPTNYWYQCDQYGTLLWDDDWNWLQYEGYELPQTVNTVRLREAPRSPSRPACKRPRHRHGLEGIPEQEEIGFGGGSSSHGPPRARAGGQNDGLMALLNQLSDMLGQEGGSSRYDSRGFRSAVRRQLKKLCRQYQLKLPPWVDGEGMTVKEFKKRTRWFIEDFTLQQTAVAGPTGVAWGRPKKKKRVMVRKKKKKRNHPPLMLLKVTKTKEAQLPIPVQLLLWDHLEQLAQLSQLSQLHQLSHVCQEPLVASVMALQVQGSLHTWWTIYWTTWKPSTQV